MHSSFLFCSICLKTPHFCDVSHLLTHIGSKGHLSKLHGLQVRAHKEADAAHQLAIYDGWFQNNGLASLLSERMQQKESRAAARKASSRAHASKTIQHQKYNQVVSDGDNTPSAPQSIPVMSPLTPLIKQEADYDQSPDFASPMPYPSIESSFGGFVPSLTAPVFSKHDQAAEDHGDEDDLAFKPVPGTLVLKGVIWPGMDLFDAAPEEAKRMRNQKKHVSVVEILERNSQLVQGTETVSSADRTMLKQRAMEDMEDDSPVEGEVVVRKPPPKLRKASAPRKPRQGTRAKKQRRQPKQRRGTLMQGTAADELFVDQSAREFDHGTPTQDIVSFEEQSPGYKLALHASLAHDYGIFDAASDQHGGTGRQVDANGQRLAMVKIESSSSTVTGMEHHQSVPMTPIKQYFQMDIGGTSAPHPASHAIDQEVVQFPNDFGSLELDVSTYPLPYTPVRPLDVRPPRTKSQRLNPLDVDFFDAFLPQGEQLSMPNPLMSAPAVAGPQIKLERMDSDEVVY